MVATAAPEPADVVVHQKDPNSTSETGSRQNANVSRRLGVVRVAAILGLLVLVAAGVAIYLFFRADMQVARAKLLAGSRVLSTACGPIEVAEEGDGPPVLVRRGLATSDSPPTSGTPSAAGPTSRSSNLECQYYWSARPTTRISRGPSCATPPAGSRGRGWSYWREAATSSSATSSGSSRKCASSSPRT
jgi:hypothetical protein